MNIPEVGQKYICVCNDRKNWVDFGQSVEVVKKQSGGVVSVKNTTTGYAFGWAYNEYPSDFKIVEGDIPKINIPMFAEDDMLQALAYMIKNFSTPVPELQPQSVHDNLRVQDILAAMQRYVAANKAVPNEWLEELIDKIELEYTQEGIYHE